MKLLRAFFLISACLILALSLQLHAQEPVNISGTRYVRDMNLKYVPTYQNFNHQNFNYGLNLYSKAKDRIQAVTNKFDIVFDSLANAYSFFSNDQMPYILEPKTGTYVVIKRGWDSLGQGTNSKDNLFIISSKDNFNTWTSPVLVYDAKVDDPKQGARYPSVFAFPMGAESSDLVYVYTAPIVPAVTTNATWNGFVNGEYSSESYATIFGNSFTYNGSKYGWLGTSSQISGGMNADNSFFLFATGLIVPSGGLPLSDNSALASRTTTDFTALNNVVPTQWASSVFVEPPAGSADSARMSSTIGLRYDNKGKMYFAVDGRFAGKDENRFVPGVSVSSDSGKTWSDFDVFPFSIARNYASSIAAETGVNPDSVYLAYNNAFAVYGEGKYSVVTILSESNNTKPDSLSLKLLVELYKDNNTWGIRKIGTVTGFYLPYTTPTNRQQRSMANNQLRYELQISPTKDNSKLLCKWVDLTGVQRPTDSTFTFATSDIFVSIRDVSSSTWGPVNNITNTADYDKITWIPDVINDINDVPILKCWSITSDTSAAGYLAAQSFNESAQYVLLGHFNPTATGVEDNNNNVIAGQIELNIYPNPAETITEISFSLPADGRASVEIFDMMGNKVQTLYNDYSSIGWHGMKFDTKELTNGTYVCNVESNGRRISKLISVIH